MRTPRSWHLAALAALAVALHALPATAQTIAIVGGRVFPVSGPPIDDATVLIRDGRIVGVGTGVSIPADARRIDARGRWVTPGLFDASTQLGLEEIGAVADTREATARSHNAIAAAFTVWSGLNPQSQYVTPARNEGVTSVAILPVGGLIAGQAAVLDLVRGDAATMIRRAPVAMVAQIGDATAAGAASRGDLLVHLRELFMDVRDYSRRKAEFERAQSRAFVASRADLEAMIPVVEGREPLLVQANKASDIESALALARDFNLRLIIGGGGEAWEVADKLAAARVPVLTGAMNNIPDSFADLGARQENAGLLRKAGIAVAIVGNAGGGDEEAFNVRNVKYEAGNAVAYGMGWEDALRSITLTPAEIFGVADHVGSLQEGRDANVVVWSGDPLDFASRAEHVFVRGQERDELSRQDLLMQRYRVLPPTYREP